METTTIAIIIFFGLISLVILYSIFSSKSSGVNPGPPASDTIQCGILDPKTITTCKAGSTTCENCQCLGSDPSAKMDCMTCQTVDNSKDPYSVDIQKENCTGENLVWDDKEQKCHLKDGSYCLPARMQDLDCNQYTGRKMLTQTKDSSGQIQYAWKCICKNDTMFSNSDGGNCNRIKVCGMDGSSDNPNISNGERGLIVKSTGKHWDVDVDKDVDPFPDSGQMSCQCVPQIEYPDNTNLTCLLNGCPPCSPGGDPTTCNCEGSSEFIDCSAISMRIDPFSGKYYTGICKIPSAVPNPCQGPSGTTYDPSKGVCSCDPNGGASSTWRNVVDANNTFGMVCQDLCGVDPNTGNNNNPCGDRGTCYIYPTGDQNVWSINACTTGIKHTQCIYLGTDPTTWNGLNHNLTLSTNQSSEAFLFEPTCYSQGGKNCPINVSVVFPNDNYYIKTDSGMYLDFKNQQLNKTRSDDLVVKLISDKDTPVGSYKIYLVKDDSFITGNGQGNLVSANKSFGGTARCTNCANGFQQDSQQLCGQSCGAKGDPCSRDCGSCCSRNCSFVWGTFDVWECD